VRQIIHSDNYNAVYLIPLANKTSSTSGFVSKLTTVNGATFTRRISYTTFTADACSTSTRTPSLL